MPYEPIVPEGQHLGTSREHDGAVTGHLFDDENKLQGHAAWEWVNDPEDAYSPSYGEAPARELTPEERELIEQITALVLTLIVIGVQAAAPHVHRWWGGTAVPAMKRGWRRLTRRETSAEAETAELLQVIQAEIASAPEPGSELMLSDPAFTMSSVEWSERYQAMRAATHFRDEQERILAKAHIVDEISAIHASGHETLTPAQFAARVRAMLAANPEALNEGTVGELQRLVESRVQRNGTASVV